MKDTLAHRATRPHFDTLRAERVMRDAGVDLLLASRRANVAYFTDTFGIVYWDYPEVAHTLEMEDDQCRAPLFFAGLPREGVSGGPFVVAHHNRVYVFREHSWVEDVRAWCDRGGKPAADVLARAITERDLAHGTVAIEMDHFPIRLFGRLRALLPHANLIDAAPILSRLRAVKSPEEWARQRQAYRIGEAIYGEVVRTLADRPPVLTVTDVRAMQMAHATRAGCPPLHFGYVFPQDNATKTAWDHVNAPSLTFAEGDAVLLDLGLVWNGYTTDFARNIVLGRASRSLREGYERIKECRRRLVELVRPGVRVSEFFAQALSVRAQLGLPEADFLGHSIGIECVEEPCLVPGVETLIEEGMTLVIELSIGVENTAFLLEDAGVVTADGWRSQTAMSVDLIELG